MGSNIIPIAARLGFTHVTVAQFSSGQWRAVLWSADCGPCLLRGDGSYAGAVEQARAYHDKRPFSTVLDLPDNFRTVDVLRCESGAVLVQEMSVGGGSAGVLAEFGPHERDEAVAFALKMLPHFAPCKLGRVDQ
jgi:hypothetical protein